MKSVDKASFANAEPPSTSSMDVDPVCKDDVIFADVEINVSARSDDVTNRVATSANALVFGSCRRPDGDDPKLNTGLDDVTITAVDVTTTDCDVTFTAGEVMVIAGDALALP